MWWLWFAGPIAVVVVYVLTGIARDDRDRRGREAASWRSGPGAGARVVRKLAPELAVALDDAGGGVPIAIYELFPRLAYLAIMSTDASVASNHQTIVAKLDGVNPTFSLRPLLVLDGNRVPNTGVAFPKDPEFAAEFLVEGDDQRGIMKWLGRPLRSALLDLPGAWLAVDGKVMTLSLFGSADEDRLDELVVTADTIFAEHGAEGGPSLLGEEEEDDDAEASPAPRKPAAPKKIASPKAATTATKPAGAKSKSAIK